LSETRRCSIATPSQLPIEYAIRKVQENQVGLKLNGTHQLLAYADYMNLLGDNINTTKKRTTTLTDASKEVGLKVNTEKTKCMMLSCHQNARKNHYINIANRCFEKYHSSIFRNDRNKSKPDAGGN
jgi:hypothetical protein